MHQTAVLPFRGTLTGRRCKFLCLEKNEPVYVGGHSAGKHLVRKRPGDPGNTKLNRSQNCALAATASWAAVRIALPAG